MGHVPHLFLPRPWEGDRLRISPEQKRHLETVLRLEGERPVEYTDGEGRVGSGTYQAGGWVARDQERALPRPSDLVVVAAPPDNKERARFLVEKLSEMGVAELRFLRSKHGQGRPPRLDRARGWAVSGLEQSRGAWLIRLPEQIVDLATLPRPYVVCDRAGRGPRGCAALGPGGDGPPPGDRRPGRRGSSAVMLEPTVSGM
jgi:16S rRNA U1498 N3-methylase RsmE